MPVGFNLNDFRQMIGNLNYGDVTIRNGKLEKINNGRIKHALNFEFLRTKPNPDANAAVREKFYKAVSDEVNEKYGSGKISDTLLKDIRKQLGINENKEADSATGITRLTRATIKNVVGLVDALSTVNRQIEDDAMTELRGIVNKLEPGREADKKMMEQFFKGAPSENYKPLQKNEFNRGKGIWNTLEMMQKGEFAPSVGNADTDTSAVDLVKYINSIRLAFKRNAGSGSEKIGEGAAIRMKQAQDVFSTIANEWTIFEPLKTSLVFSLRKKLNNPGIEINKDNVIRYIHRYESRIIAKCAQTKSLTESISESNDRAKAKRYGEFLAEELLNDNIFKNYNIIDEDDDFDEEDVAGSSDVKINEVKDIAKEKTEL